MLSQKVAIQNKWMSAIETQMLEYGHSKTVAKLNKKIKDHYEKYLKVYLVTGQ